MNDLSLPTMDINQLSSGGLRVVPSPKRDMWWTSSPTSSLDGARNLFDNSSPQQQHSVRNIIRDQQPKKEIRSRENSDTDYDSEGSRDKDV